MDSSPTRSFPRDSLISLINSINQGNHPNPFLRPILFTRSPFSNCPKTIPFSFWKLSNSILRLHSLLSILRNTHPIPRQFHVSTFQACNCLSIDFVLDHGTTTAWSTSEYCQIPQLTYLRVDNPTHFLGELFASFEPINRSTKEVVNEVEGETTRVMSVVVSTNENTQPLRVPHDDRCGVHFAYAVFVDLRFITRRRCCDVTFLMLDRSANMVQCNQE